MAKKLERNKTGQELIEEAGIAPALVRNSVQTPTQEVNMNEYAEYSKSNFGEIEFRRHTDLVWSIGNIRRHKHELNSFGAIKGFLNALADLADGIYPVAEYGLHLTTDPAQFLDLYTADAVGHVNFYALNTDTDAAKLVKGMKPEKENEEYWHILNLRKGRLVLGRPVTPWLSENKEALFGEEGPGFFDQKRNTEDWNRVFKQEGLEWAMRVMKGVAKVVCSFKPGKNTPEWKFKQQVVTLEKKYALFGIEKDERREIKAEITNKAISQEQNATGTYYIEQHEVVRAAAEEQAETLTIIVEGEERPATVKELVRATIQKVRGSVHIGGPVYLRSEASVLSEVRSASTMRAQLEVVRFAE